MYDARRVETYVDVMSIGELPVGRVKAVIVGDRKIAVGRTASGVFAMDNTCPHRGGPLAEGDIIGNELICPWHLWGFDVATGACAGNMEIAVATHEVKVEGERILVKLS